MTPPAATRVACDSLVALGNSTADGCVHFAKNSDRPADECQPLTLVQARQHPPQSRLRCTYIDIPQVQETARVIGSRPHWCWGFEHGLNQHGVAIGNHTVFTKDALAGKGLIGMDLVRLGLERGRNAEAAVHTITTLLEEYGQGGSGYGDKEWPYHNSFLIADRRAAFVLETSDRNWACRGVTDLASMSNHVTIGTDWDALSPGAVAHAQEQGWWDANHDRRFDFAAAYRDVSMAPEAISAGRHTRTCSLLAAGRGKVDITALRAALRDHYGSMAPRSDLTPDNPEYFSVCMHADPVGTTTASIIARLTPDDDEPLLYWASLGSPCVGVFLPLFVDCDIPAPLSRGGASAQADSAWWRFKKLLTCVEADWQARLPKVRRIWDGFEAAVSTQLSQQSILKQSHESRRRFLEETCAAALATLEDLISGFEKQS